MTMPKSKPIPQPPFSTNLLEELYPNVSLAGLTRGKRNDLVVSSIKDPGGKEYVVSRLGDSIWDFHGNTVTRNTKVSEMRVQWPTDLPADLVADAKGALYAWLKRGRPGRKAPAHRSVIVRAQKCIDISRYFAGLQVSGFDQIHSIHIHDYIHQLRREKNSGHSIYRKVEILDIVWRFNNELLRPLKIDPWGQQGMLATCGLPRSKDYRVARTAVIPVEIQAAIFNYCERTIREAPALMAAYRRGELASWFDDRVIAFRDAVLYLVQITTGMRNAEAIAIKSSSWRTEVRDGITFHWIRTIETKTGKGSVEFLAPKETIEALALLEQYARPLQMRLRREQTRLLELVNERQNKARGRLDPSALIQKFQRLDAIGATIDCLFLGLDAKSGGDGGETEHRVVPLSNAASGRALKRVASSAGVDWQLANHQCRRTFAWTVANSQLGRTSLIFLKWQLKHSSLSMTQLYAANSEQDESLYNEISDAYNEVKAALISSWFDDHTPLSGGAGRKILRTRAIAISNRKDLLRHTSEHVSVRATGHSWCLAETRGCGGAGIYEETLCTDCSASVIDAHFKTTWEGLHEQNEELLNVTDCGPAVIDRANRLVRRSAAVLSELGIAPRRKGSIT